MLTNASCTSEGGPDRGSAFLAQLGGDVLDHAAGLAVGGGDLVAGHAPALHPVFDGLTLRQVEPVLVDEDALVLQARHDRSLCERWVAREGWNYEALNVDPFYA